MVVNWEAFAISFSTIQDLVWHQLGHMQVSTSLQTDNHANSPPLSFFTGRMPFLPPDQQRQSTEGTKKQSAYKYLQTIYSPKYN